MNKLEDLFKYRSIEDRGYITPCWIWTACKDKNGYGITRIKYDKISVHRASFIFINSPTKLKILHKCDVSACFNPEHLFEGTQKDNIRDAVSKRRHRNSKRTHCKNGHPYTDDNTYIRIRSNGNKERRCKICALSQNKKFFNSIGSYPNYTRLEQA